jgi:hypothetical protein
MPEVDDEEPEVVPGGETEESEITDRQDGNAEKGGASVNKPSPGRLPARASRRWPLGSSAAKGNMLAERSDYATENRLVVRDDKSATESRSVNE